MGRGLLVGGRLPRRGQARASERLLFGLDEYARVWLHEDGDEFLVRDLVAIRVVERLAEIGYFNEHPEEEAERLGQLPKVE